MTTLLRGDDMPSGRVLPKVFADVPSAEEVKAANEAVKRAKGTTGGLVILSVLLAGALIAAVAFIVFNPETGKWATKYEEASNDVRTLTADVKRLSGEVETEKAAANSIRNTYASYLQVSNLEKSLAESRESIRKLIEQAPGAQGVRDPEGWNAYRNLTRWTAYPNIGDWKAYVVENLQRQQNSIDALKVKIDAFIRDTGTGGATQPVKVCPDNRPNC